MLQKYRNIITKREGLKGNLKAVRVGLPCVKRESNPQFNLGRVTCYHYTINAEFCAEHFRILFRTLSYSLSEYFRILFRTLSYSFPNTFVFFSEYFRILFRVTWIEQVTFRLLLSLPLQSDASTN